MHLTPALSCGPRGTLLCPAAHRIFNDRGIAKSVNRRSRQLQRFVMWQHEYLPFYKGLVCLGSCHQALASSIMPWTLSEFELATMPYGFVTMIWTLSSCLGLCHPSLDLATEQCIRKANHNCFSSCLGPYPAFDLVTMPFLNNSFFQILRFLSA